MNNNTNLTQAGYLSEHVKSIYRNSGFNEDEDQINQALIDHVLFITMKFDGVQFEGSRSDPAIYLNRFKSWYNSKLICSLGHHLKRKRHLQPLCYAFVDFPSSRTQRSPNSTECASNASHGVYDQTRNPGGPIEFLNSGLLHIHAVMALIPDQGLKCRLPMMTPYLGLRPQQVGHVDVQPFNPELGSLENLFNYAKKGADQIGTSYKGDCWGIYPEW